MADAKKTPKMLSPKGIAIYPKLTKPDTKFKAEGEYSIKLRITQEQADDLYNKVKPMLDEYKKSEAWKKTVDTLTKKMGKGKVKLTELDFSKPVNTDDGDPTGDATVTFKAKASGKKKDNTEWKRGPIATFDAKGTPLKNVQVWGGSEVKVSFKPMPWINPKGEYGIKLGLEAVQIIKLVSGGGGSASDYGFGEEDGYVADDEGEGADLGEDTSAEKPADGEGSGGDDF